MAKYQPRDIGKFVPFVAPNYPDYILIKVGDGEFRSLDKGRYASPQNGLLWIDTTLVHVNLDSNQRVIPIVLCPFVGGQVHFRGGPYVLGECRCSHCAANPAR